MLIRPEAAHRPAAGARRRSFLASGPLAALGLLLLACPQPRLGIEVEAARQSARRVIAEVRPESPETARHLEGLLRQAEAATVPELDRPALGREPGEVEEAWHRVAVASGRALLDLRRRQEAARQRWTWLESATEAEVAWAQDSLAEAGMGRQEAQAVQQAMVQLELARRQAAGGEYRKAVAAAETARAFAQRTEASREAMYARFEDPRLLAQWRRWAEETLEDSRRSGRPAILVDKQDRQLHLYRAGRLVATFPAELGTDGLRPKRHAGDQATPEGKYRIIQRKEGRQTIFHKALLIDYPNPQDLERLRKGKRQGSIPARTGAGGLIEIHGDGGTGRDWTDGCVALRNAHMDLLYPEIPVGTPVTIVGAL